MKPVKILVAEDDIHIRQGLMDTLESENYQVVGAGDGRQALGFFKNEPFDLVLLDIMMPGKSGYDVCRAIRSMDEEVSIIMLTAKGEEIDKVVGLQLGADDYITKPFGIHELLARISAVLRRTKREKPAQKDPLKARFRFGEYEVNPAAFKLSGQNRTVDLSKRELDLIQYFHDHSGEVLSRDSILNAVWGINYLGTTRTLDQHIAQLRKKVESDPSEPCLITTVHGVGYRYEP